MSQIADAEGVLSALNSPEEATRKFAAFRLQTAVGNPSFAEEFIGGGGAEIVRHIITTARGTTLSHTLQALANLLDNEQGWEIFETSGVNEFVERLVEILVNERLVNIHRGTLSTILMIVSHANSKHPDCGVLSKNALRALKPAIAIYPKFLDAVLDKQLSDDNTLVAVAISLVTALIRDALYNIDETGNEAGKSTVFGEDWDDFVRDFQRKGVMRRAYQLMITGALQDLAQPLLDVQNVNKEILRKYKNTPFDGSKSEHRRIIKKMYILATKGPEGLKDASQLSPEKSTFGGQSINGNSAQSFSLDDDMSKMGSVRHHPEKWRSLGFSSESPSGDFADIGCLGLQDLQAYINGQPDTFYRIIQEQSIKPLSERCPLAQCSLSVSWILYQHFECDENKRSSVSVREIESVEFDEKVFRPLILHWTRLHMATLTAFIRLWAATQASLKDFSKIFWLVELLVSKVVGGAKRTTRIQQVEVQMADTSLRELRTLEVQIIKDRFQVKHHDHLEQIRAKYRADAMAFAREQRIRRMLVGGWFTYTIHRENGTSHTIHRFAKLSTNRLYVHWADFDSKAKDDYKIIELKKKFAVKEVASVEANGLGTPQAAAPPSRDRSRDDFDDEYDDDDDEASLSSESSRSTVRGNITTSIKPDETRRIVIFTRILAVSSPKSPNSSTSAPSTADSDKRRERAILNLETTSQDLAAEWIDGLLMMLEQEPITDETHNMVRMLSESSMRIRLLNVDMLADLNDGLEGKMAEVEISDEGLDAEYYYA